MNVLRRCPQHTMQKCQTNGQSILGGGAAVVVAIFSHFDELKIVACFAFANDDGLLTNVHLFSQLISNRASAQLFLPAL